ncbi:MAG: hypothetical protein K2M47_02810 [Clostridiales bacterium]|nr:hypothetical protein [Clostridiales bacterium]
MENKNLKTAVYLLTGMIGFGIGLILVSLFMSFMDINVNSALTGMVGASSASLELFDGDWSMLDVSPVFVILSYLVLLAGLVIMAVDASVKQKVKKKVKGLNFAGLALSVVGFVLLIVSIIVTKSQVEDSMDKIMIATVKMTDEGASLTDQQILAAIRMVMSYSLGIGSIMAIIGGIIALIGCVLIVIPALDPIKLAEQPAANTAAPAAAAPTPAATDYAPTAPAAEQPTETNDNNTDTIA